MDLKSFVSEQNIARYRRMLARCDDDKQRRIIDRLLSAEIATRNGATPGPSFATFHGVAAGLTQGAET